MTYEQEQAEVRAVIAQYKETIGEVFGMRNFPNRRFKISGEQSYFAQGVVFYDRGVRLVIDEETFEDGVAKWCPFLILRGNELNTPAIRLNTL